MVVVGIFRVFGRDGIPFSQSRCEILIVFLINHLSSSCFTPSFGERNASSEERTISNVGLLGRREWKPRKVVQSFTRITLSKEVVSREMHQSARDDVVDKQLFARVSERRQVPLRLGDESLNFLAFHLFAIGCERLQSKRNSLLLAEVGKSLDEMEHRASRSPIGSELISVAHSVFFVNVSHEQIP